jgi:ComF family protein
LSEYDAAFAYAVYDGKIRDLIHMFKYGGVRELAQPLGRMIIAGLPLGIPFDAIVPMPMHWLRQWLRGYNQAELLARAVAHHTGLPLLNALRRTRAVAPQAGLTRAQRRQPQAVKGKQILLVDDVLTTGATARAAAAALKKAGAARVTVLALARADRRQLAGGWSGGTSYTIALGAR